MKPKNLESLFSKPLFSFHSEEVSKMIGSLASMCLERTNLAACPISTNWFTRLYDFEGKLPVHTKTNFIAQLEKTSHISKSSMCNATGHCQAELWKESFCSKDRMNVPIVDYYSITKCFLETVLMYVSQHLIQLLNSILTIWRVLLHIYTIIQHLNICGSRGKRYSESQPKMMSHLLLGNSTLCLYSTKRWNRTIM